MGKKSDVSVKNTGGTSGVFNTAMGSHAKTATGTDKKTGSETKAYGSTPQQARDNLNKKSGN